MEMTLEEEIDCARRLEAATYAQYLLDVGDERPGLSRVVADGEAARRELWAAHEGLVRAVASRWCHRRGDLFDELVQEGHLILADVMARYDWRRDVRLATMAWPWLHRGMQEVMRRRSRWDEKTTHVPVGFEYPADVVEEEPVGEYLGLLSPRERAVVVARAHGRPRAELAAEMGISVGALTRLERRVLRLLRQAGLQQTA